MYSGLTLKMVLLSKPVQPSSLTTPCWRIQWDLEVGPLTTFSLHLSATVLFSPTKIQTASIASMDTWCRGLLLFLYLLLITQLFGSNKTTLLHFSVDVVRVGPTLRPAPGWAYEPACLLRTSQSLGHNAYGTPHIWICDPKRVNETQF